MSGNLDTLRSLPEILIFTSQLIQYSLDKACVHVCVGVCVHASALTPLFVFSVSTYVSGNVK